MWGFEDSADLEKIEMFRELWEAVDNRVTQFDPPSEGLTVKVHKAMDRWLVNKTSFDWEEAGDLSSTLTHDLGQPMTFGGQGSGVEGPTSQDPG